MPLLGRLQQRDLGKGQLRAVVDNCPATGHHRGLRPPRLRLDEEQPGEQLEAGLDAQVRLIECDEACDLCDALGSQMMELEAIVGQELLEKAAYGEPHPPHHMRDKDDLLLISRLRVKSRRHGEAVPSPCSSGQGSRSRAGS